MIKKAENKKVTNDRTYGDRDSTRLKDVKMIRNNDVVRTWKLRQDESWDTIFRSKTKDGPVLSLGCQPCLKYHTKGVCYSDCRFIKSHKVLKD